ncbi:hypothetical protein [Streptacidiphilus sp. MAP5-3]|uniref:hypothetical protein n=1 Tax=unclassified Streptacidiphilus TaxID=2643834 RepID=UPI003517AB5A
MQSGESRENGRSQLRLAAVVGEIEGLWTAWLRARGTGRRQRLLAELGQAGARLAAEAAQAQRALPRSSESPVSPTSPLRLPQPRTRRNRRLVAARRGAEWIAGRFSD